MRDARRVLASGLTPSAIMPTGIRIRQESRWIRKSPIELLNPKSLLTHLSQEKRDVDYPT
jgi:hypothetical protein